MTIFYEGICTVCIYRNLNYAGTTVCEMGFVLVTVSKPNKQLQASVYSQRQMSTVHFYHVWAR